jgi:LCP family protein required for cell wall assembly
VTHLTGQRRPTRAWRVTSIVLVLCLAGAAGIAGIVSIVGGLFDLKLSTISEPFPAEAVRPPVATGPAASAQNILLLGSDTWDRVNGSIAGISKQRSDTIMVVHIPADRKHVYVMSILRDSWVDLPGHGFDKVNAALSYGGVPLALQVVEGLIGARIDHVALVDYAGFSGLTDALGGVDVNNPVGFDSSAISHYFPAGVQHLSGEDTLAFAREWRAFPDGDFQRVRNQQLVMQATLTKAMQKDTLVDPVKVGALLGAVRPFVAVDEGLNVDYLTSLAASLASIRSADFTFFTAPTLGVAESDDGQSIVNLDLDKMAVVRQAFQSDTLHTYVPEFQTMQPQLVPVQAPAPVPVPAAG